VTSPPIERSRVVLGLALFALSVLFSVWMHDDRHRVASLLVFALPPLLLLPGVMRGSGRVALLAGVLGLFWFSHGVVVAYGRPAEAAYAWGELVLSVAIVLAASWPGLSKRFARNKS
jgi:uncharacterized membrane protein